MYTVKTTRLSADLSEMLPRWRAFYAERGEGLMYRDPDFLMALYQEGEQKVTREDLYVFFLLRGDEIVGALPMVLVQWPLELVMGEMALAKPPLRRFLLPYSDANLPEETAAFDRVFEAVQAESKAFDAVFYEDLRVGSYLHDYLQSSQLIRGGFRLYYSDEPEHHSIAHLGDSMTEYMSKHSTKTRKKLRYTIKTLEKKEGPVEVIPVQRPEEVDAFVDKAYQISLKSYQYNLFAAGIRKPEKLKRYLRFMAQHGWLRSYLLECNGKPCSFLIGYQDAANFYYIDVAYDQAWGKHSPGKVLQIKVFEDLFERNTPKLYDFCGGHGDQKVFFENDSYEQRDGYMFPRRLYPRLMEAGHSSTHFVHRTMSDLLQRYKLKDKIKRGLRRASVAFKGKQG